MPAYAISKLSVDAYIFAVLYGKCIDLGADRTHAAVLVDDSWRFRMLAFGTGRPPISTRTAIVNLIQHAAQAGTKMRDAFIYTTELPTEMCLGMARLSGIARIYTVVSGQIGRVAISRTAHADPRGILSDSAGVAADAP